MTAAEKTVLVGVEDMSTAGIVGVEAARVAMDQQATVVILLHVLNQHPVLNSMFGMGNYCAPITETAEEAATVLTLAEQAFRGEFAALQRPAPLIDREVVDGDPARAIEQVAARRGASTIVLGARRPHALGRLAHPDVRAHVAAHASCHLHVALLQEAAGS